MRSVAGGGAELGDGGLATAAGFCGPADVGADAAGNLFVVDFGQFCDGPGGGTIRKIGADGTIGTLAGATGVIGFSGDGGPASRAQIDSPIALAVTRDGDVYFSDSGNFRIRKIDRSGVITTVAGTGEQGYSGDGGPARSARLGELQGLALDARGNLYFADFAAVRKIDRSGTITTVAGSGRFGSYTTADDVPVRLREPGDGGPATEAKLTPIDVAVDRDDHLYISDFHSGRVHEVDQKGVIRTVAGSGDGRRDGRDGRATSIGLVDPWGIAVDRQGNLFIAEHHGQRIRMVNRRGRMTTIAGTGKEGFVADAGVAKKLRFEDPGHVLATDSGLLYVTDYFNARIWALRYR
jgi:sugar lactone lactonase YvrE